MVLGDVADTVVESATRVVMIRSMVCSAGSRS